MEINVGFIEVVCSENESFREDNSIEKLGIVKMKLQDYDGNDDWEEYLMQFEIFVEINQWNDVIKVLYLVGSLKGVVRIIFNELKVIERRRFQSLVIVLENCFGFVNCVEMYKL